MRCRASLFGQIRITTSLPVSSEYFVSTQAYPKYPRSYAERIKKRRLELRLIRRRVAFWLGVHTLSVANWEQGKHLPSVQNRCKLCRFLGGKLDTD